MKNLEDSEGFFTARVQNAAPCGTTRNPDATSGRERFSPAASVLGPVHARTRTACISNASGVAPAVAGQQLEDGPLLLQAIAWTRPPVRLGLLPRHAVTLLVPAAPRSAGASTRTGAGSGDSPPAGASNSGRV